MESRAFIVGLIVGILATGDAHLARVSLFNHFAFGVGLALWVIVLKPI
jgi:hypothetical protein